MTPGDRERAISYLQQTRQNLLNATEKLSPAQLRFKPSPDRWSVAECLEHIITVENRCLDGITNAMQQAPDSSRRSAFDGRDDELVQVLTDRTNRRQAPEVIYPSSRWPPEKLVSELEAVRRRSLDCAANAPDDFRKHFFSHRAFGDLDCYQWILLVAAHGDRHRVQIEEVLAAPNFPRAAAAG